LLIVPLTLAAGGLWFNYAQGQYDRELEEAHQKHELEIQELRAQDAAFQAYLDRMGTLLTERDLSTKTAGSVESKLASAYTAALLDAASPEYKRSTLRFLYNTALIVKDQEIVDLVQNDLTHASLDHIYLEEAELAAVNLDNARLESSYLKGANLINSDLHDANLDSAYLYNSELSGVSLRDANLHYSDLTGALLVSADLRDADLSASDLTDADLRTKLRDSFGQLRRTRLKDTNFKNALLDDAKLHGVDLSQAKNLTQEQTEQADGDSSTRLPPKLDRPAAWLK
jgi:uncharacterized protein YjbI with pentapeptide repeats